MSLQLPDHFELEVSALAEQGVVIVRAMEVLPVSGWREYRWFLGDENGEPEPELMPGIVHSFPDGLEIEVLTGPAGCLAGAETGQISLRCNEPPEDVLVICTRRFCVELDPDLPPVPEGGDVISNQVLLHFTPLQAANWGTFQTVSGPGSGAAEKPGKPKVPGAPELPQP